MPIAIRYQDPDLQQRLAQRYVMGMLSPAATRRFDALRDGVPALDQQVRDWDEQLQPMADAVPALEPSNRLWEQIEATIQPDKPSRLRAVWDNVRFARGLAFASSIAAIAFALLLVLPGTTPTTPGTPSVDYVAVLADGAGQPRFVATAMEASKQFDIRVFGEQLVGDSDYQLWALSKTDGEARSLGLIDPSAPSQRTLSESDWRLITDAEELLVTAEMRGGSAIGEPSDDVISRGPCLRLSTG